MSWRLAPLLFAAIACVLPCLGCAGVRTYFANGLKVGPNYRRPPAPVAPDWIDAEDMRIRKEQSPELAQWWVVFNDPVLNQLVADSYRQNLTLREAGFRILQNRALLGIAVGNFFPQQQYMQGSYTRDAISTAAANRPFVIEQYFPQWEGGFTLNWELDFWGRYRRAVASANDKLDASVEDFDAVLVTLFGDVAQAYVQIRILEQQVALTKANVDLQRQTLAIATARFKGGLVTELDVDQAQSILSQTEAQVPQLEITLRQTSNRLCVLLGIPPEELQRRMLPQPIPTVAPEVAVGIPTDLVRRRPDVRRAERYAAAQAEQIGVAESDFFPQFALNGTFYYQALEFKQLFQGDALGGMWGPSFQWNLLNYGRIVNNVRLQDAKFQELVVYYQNTVLTAGQEVENGLVAFLRSQLQARYMAESVVAAKKAVDIAVAQYRAGLTDFNRVSLVEQNLVTQQNSYAQAFGAIAQGLVQTYRALGGGWQIRLDPNAGAQPGLPPPDPNRPLIPAPMPLLTPPVVPMPVAVPAPMRKAPPVLENPDGSPVRPVIPAPAPESVPAVPGVPSASPPALPPQKPADHGQAPHLLPPAAAQAPAGRDSARRVPYFAPPPPDASATTPINTARIATPALPLNAPARAVGFAAPASNARGQAAGFSSTQIERQQSPVTAPPPVGGNQTPTSPTIRSSASDLPVELRGGTRTTQFPATREPRELLPAVRDSFWFGVSGLPFGNGSTSP